MTLRVCSVSGCPELQPETKCATHRSEAERRRGTRQQRGYDKRHQSLRQRYQRRMDHGETFVCWRPRCDRIIDPDAWHLGHDDRDRSITRGPECPECNLRAAGLTSHGISPDA